MLWLLVGTLLIVIGCGASGPVVKSGCEWTKAIYPTKADVDVISASLLDQIIEHNETREEICGK